MAFAEYGVYMSVKILCTSLKIIVSVSAMVFAALAPALHIRITGLLSFLFFVSLWAFLANFFRLLGIDANHRALYFPLIGILSFGLLFRAWGIPFEEVGITFSARPASMLLPLILTPTLLLLYVFLSSIRMNRNLSLRLVGGRAAQTVSAMLAGANEELWFRGAILFGLIQFQPLVAVLVSSVLFSATHFKSGSFMMVWSLLLGLSFGVPVALSGSLLGAIVGHAIFNLVSTNLVSNGKGELHEGQPAGI